jgi:hypothetical protein
MSRQNLTARKKGNPAKRTAFLGDKKEKAKSKHKKKKGWGQTPRTYLQRERDLTPLIGII